MRDISRARLSLLIVEDDKPVLDVFGAMLPRKFPQTDIHLAVDGEMGLGLFKEYVPDIVVTDIKMPKMDGVEMAEKIKAIKADTRIIVMTAFSDRINVAKFRSVGISHYLLKPVNFGEMVTAIARLVEEIQSQRE
ncbi:response regulator [Geomonas sp. RF6]|uniref:response regulator n=1 Tax=Geomonas sp. RF6 TaxID=2897342 RepID=UPI001E30630A|nr:response regulator [Geomonas sp. RF6]UFS69977.1 response regulator [Geomonas sp. RF6]